MLVETLVVGQLSTNSYLVYCQFTKEALIIDPGDAADFIIGKIADLQIIPKAILLTHGHFDHLLAVCELKLAYNIPFCLHPKDLPILTRTQKTAKYFLGYDVDLPPPVDKYLKQGMKIKFGKQKLQVIETPGHTQGSVCFYDGKKILFAGDTLFADGSFGRIDLEGGNESQIKKSIQKILKLPERTIIYPGHGRTTLVAEEKNYYKIS